MPAAPLPSPAPQRLGSMDAFRGWVMFLMAAELLKLPELAEHFPQSGFWQTIKFHTEHVKWTGCGLHDLIQPAFSFLVGVAMPFSLASRRSKGQSPVWMWIHALWRSLLLVLLGVFLRSVGKPMTYWTFEDTLSQIGLGYPFLFALGFAGPKVRWTTLGVILVGYWLAFACFRLPGPDFDYQAVNVPDPAIYWFKDFAAHWNMNCNAGWAFDVWFLNLFPRVKPFVGLTGGYLTLSFIPTLGTMLLGLIAGAWIRQSRSADAAAPDLAPTDAKVQAGRAAERLLMKLLVTGLLCMGLAWLCQQSGICPVVKKIWTPSWTLYSGGWCFLILATFYFVIDVVGWKSWAFPLIVIGMNSIAMYLLVHLTAGFFKSTLRTHLGPVFKAFGEVYGPTVEGAAILLILWLVLWWMYRRKLFLKI